MSFPTVPDLTPFEPSVTPNLMAGGPYDAQLTAIENYLKQLGAYIDSAVEGVATQVAAAQTEIDKMQTATYTPTGGSETYPLFNADGSAGTALTQIATGIGAADTMAEAAQATAEEAHGVATTAQSDAAKAKETATAAQNDATEAKTWTDNASSVSGVLPSAINADLDGVETSSAKLFTARGTKGVFLDNLFNLISNLVLAAPNGDHTKLLGDLGDNPNYLLNSPDVHSSAALTYAAKEPAYEGSVYGVPVSVSADGTFALAVDGSFTIHTGETLFVCDSESGTYSAGQMLTYTGSADVALDATAKALDGVSVLYTPEAGASMPTQNPTSDAQLTAGELSGTVHKTADGSWLYVAQS